MPVMHQRTNIYYGLTFVNLVYYGLRGRQGLVINAANDWRDGWPQVLIHR